MASFNVQPLSRFAGASTSIRRPREFACFSYDDDRNLLPLSELSLRYYHPPFFNAQGEADQRRHPLDLSRGFDRFKQHDDQTDEHLNALLDTLEVYERREGTIVEADFVTWRGMMTKVRPLSRVALQGLRELCADADVDAGRSS